MHIPQGHAVGWQCLQVSKRTLHKACCMYVNVKVAAHALQSGERTLLKNLGSWLGLLTIKQNKMVMQKDLDVKGLMFEAYEQVWVTSSTIGNHSSECPLAVMPHACHIVCLRCAPAILCAPAVCIAGMHWQQADHVPNASAADCAHGAPCWRRSCTWAQASSCQAGTF